MLQIEPLIIVCHPVLWYAALLCCRVHTAAVFALWCGGLDAQSVSLGHVLLMLLFPLFAMCCGHGVLMCCVYLHGSTNIRVWALAMSS